MRTSFKTLAALVMISPVLAGCATKKWTQARMDTFYRLNIAHTDSAVAREASERMMGDSSLRADMVALRRDLDSLRSEFNVKITALESGMRFAFPVNFAFDDATVRPEDQEALNRFAQVYGKYYTGAVLTVEGFADPAGSQRYNLALSKRRAETVRDYLATQGMNAEVIRAVGYGKTRLVVPGAERDDPGAEQNRRVVFVIESRGDSTRAVASVTPQ